MARVQVDVESRATGFVDMLRLEGKTHMLSKTTIKVFRLNDLNVFTV